LAAAAVVLITMVGVTACGGNDVESQMLKPNAKSAQSASDSDSDAASNNEKAPAGAAVVKIELGEFYVKPDVSSVKAGDVSFAVTNKGKVPHEFVVIKTDVAPGDLPMESDGTASEEGSVGEVAELTPGSSGTLNVKLAAGKYVLICNVPGHYAGHQYVGFTVK
jgi:uncharacterized cupredoxin-like copper-binding protein